MKNRSSTPGETRAPAQPIQAYRATFVPAATRPEWTHEENALLGHSTRLAGDLLANRQLAHRVYSEDTAVSQAAGSLLYAVAFVPVVAIVTGALMLLARWALQGNGWLFFLLWLLLWGGACLAALIINRQQGLHFSSAGIAHHEIESRADLAKHIVDRHIELLEKKWQLPTD